ncbi:hypothetical protein [Methylobacterium aquaticum]|uniref:hypothetical protein n=1 Tax=Methylobacterium aquaticum TaxID=270351 RepID=UPI0019341E8B|nr:hypothetical protein [Methylobacterium aquaticum]QRE77350.1 hypothetical protein F1D61_30915 [Methylobacterium aquaticum]
MSEIRALYAGDEEHLTRSERETFEHLFEQAENRVRKPVEPVEAPEPAKALAAAEAPQESAFEPWSDYEGRIRKLAQNISTADQAGGLRKVWKAGKDYRAIMEERKIATREQRVALTAVVQEAIKRAEAPPAEVAPAAVTVPGVTDQDPEAVRACGERVFAALSAAPTKEKAFLIWSRSQRDRDDCGASAEVLAAWTKEYQAIRKALPEEAA